jgi:hypothetical protein
VAVGAFAFDESVWQEAFVVLAVGEDYFFGVDVAVLVECLVEFLDEFFVCWALCSGVVAEL